MEAVKKDEVEEVKGGEVLFCGATLWDTIGRKKTGEGNLYSPTRLRPLVGVDIRFVGAGCVSCHCVALDVAGRCYTWGRNERSQLGHGDTLQRDRPTVVSELLKFKIIGAGAGRSHTAVLTDDGESLAFEIEMLPVRCQVTDVTRVACGAEFTVWLSSVEGASILTVGLPQYGQLGHRTYNEYNTKDSSVRLVYEPQPHPKAIAFFAEETVVAVDSNGYVYTWGFGGYGRLGHREQKDEWTPRRIDVFQSHNVLPPNAIVSAGAANSACTAAGGQLYMWGKIKNTGDDWIGWNLRCMDSGNMHHFVGADSSCISWGHAQNGELGYGPDAQKSSAVPKKVEGMHIISVACGLAHSMVVVSRKDVGKRLDEKSRSLTRQSQDLLEKLLPLPLEIPIKGSKSGKGSSSDEDEEEDPGTEDSEEEIANGKTKRQQKNTGKPGSSGRGRGRPPGSKKQPQQQQPQEKRKRGRPRK
ncbi:RCC2-like protein [Drosera capensis]